MNRRTRVTLGSLLGFTLAFSNSVRAECPYYTLEGAFMTSTVVFVGRATNQQVVAATHPPPDRVNRVTETTFEVEDEWKGTSNRTVRIQTCGWTLGNETVTCSEDVRFVVGERYVVFAGGEPLETSGCRPTARVDRAERTLQWLADKPRRLVRP
jgi:hypothetical protein